MFLPAFVHRARLMDRRMSLRVSERCDSQKFVNSLKFSETHWDQPGLFILYSAATSTIS